MKLTIDLERSGEWLHVRSKREQRIIRNSNLIASQVAASTEDHGSRAETYSYSSPDSPIPILQASFCSISLHIGILTFFHRIVGRPS